MSFSYFLLMNIINTYRQYISHFQSPKDMPQILAENLSEMLEKKNLVLNE